MLLAVGRGMDAATCIHTHRERQVQLQRRTDLHRESMMMARMPSHSLSPTSSLLRRQVQGQGSPDFLPLPLPPQPLMPRHAPQPLPLDPLSLFLILFSRASSWASLSPLSSSCLSTMLHNSSQLVSVLGSLLSSLLSLLSQALLLPLVP